MILLNLNARATLQVGSPNLMHLHTDQMVGKEKWIRATRSSTQIARHIRHILQNLVAHRRQLHTIRVIAQPPYKP